MSQNFEKKTTKRGLESVRKSASGRFVLTQRILYGHQTTLSFSAYFRPFVGLGNVAPLNPLTKSLFR